MYNHFCKIFPNILRIIQDDGKDRDDVVGIHSPKPVAFTLIRTLTFLDFVHRPFDTIEANVIFARLSTINPSLCI